jgi:predicted Zn-dependent protease
MIRPIRHLAGAVSLLSVVIAGSCVKNPATGERDLMLVSEAQEIQMGREAAQQVEREFGFIEDKALTSFVEEVGMEMANSSERPDLPWEFHVLDSPAVNAFALPGGFIYLTRGILAHMNSEAAMAGVLGHEIAHVTARHSAQQISRAQLANLGMGLGMVFVPEVRPFGDLLGTGMGLLFLKFSRDHERQSDELGVRYALNAGYDPTQMARFFEVLDRLSEDSGTVIPNWLSTHPDPENREQAILEMARSRNLTSSDLEVAEVSFKRRLEGLVYGENPREGFMDGNMFKHPDLRFQITFPSDWKVQNTRQAVYAGSSRAALQLTASNVNRAVDPVDHASRFFNRQGIRYGRGRRDEIHGFSAYLAAFEARTQAGTVAGESGFIKDGDLIYEILGYSRASDAGRYRSVFLDIIGSFRRLTDRRALEVQPRRLELYRVPRRMTLREALERSGSDPAEADDLAILNNAYLDDPIEEGILVKTVEPSETKNGRPGGGAERDDGRIPGPRNVNSASNREHSWWK